MHLLLLLAALSFSVKEEGNGFFSASISEKNLSVTAAFPGKPAGEDGKLAYVNPTPLVQMSLIVAKRDKSSSENLSESILKLVLEEYESAKMEVEEIKTGTPEKSTNPERYQVQYIIDLKGGIREFTTLSLYRLEEWDVMAMTRFILSAEDKNDPAFRVKGNSLANQFLESVRVN